MNSRKTRAWEFRLHTGEQVSALQSEWTPLASRDSVVGHAQEVAGRGDLSEWPRETSVP